MYTCHECLRKYTKDTGNVDERKCDICIDEYLQELNKEHCEHKNTEWIPSEPEINVQEDNICLDCGKSVDFPQPNWDLIIKEIK